MSEQKSLAKNSIYNVVYKMLNVLFPLITATYIARVLLAAGVGKVSYAQNIVGYFTLIAALGIPNYGTREIAKARENKKEVNKTFSELFSINFISTVFCIIAYYIMIFTFRQFNENLNLYIVVGLAIVFNIFNVDWFYQGVEEYKYIAARSFFIKLISLICIFIFVRNQNDLIAYAIIYCLGIGGNNILNMLNLKRHNVKLTFKEILIKKHLKPIFILLASVIAIELYTMLDTTMIGIFCKSENVGYYTNALKLIKILISVVTAIGGVLLPRLSYYHMNNMNEECSKVVSKVFSIMLFLFVPCEIGIFLTAEQIMPLFFGESFSPGVITLQIASFLICTLGFSNLFGTQILLTYGKEKKLLICTIIGAISNIALNLILIPKFEQNGAAVASVISETIVTLMAFNFSRKYVKIKVDKKLIITLIISSILLGFVVIVINNLITNEKLKLIFSILFGVISYIGTNIVLKNPIIKEMLKIVKKNKQK